MLLLLFLVLPIISFLVWRFFKEQPVRNLQNTALLITGCDSGFGYGATKLLASKGVTVFAGCLTESGKQRLLSEFPPTSSTPNNNNNKVFPFVLDVTESESVSKAVQYVEETLPENIENFSLLNNAGVGDGHFIEFTDVEVYKKVMEVNFFGLVRVTKAFLPLVRGGTKGRKGGRVLNLTSIAGVISLYAGSAYSCSKFAAEAFSDALRLELKSFQVPVVVIEPAFAKTQMVSNLPKVAKFLEVSEELLQAYGGEAFRKRCLNNLEKLPSLAEDIQVVLETILKAYATEKPRPRYPVTKLAYFLYYLNFLPTEFVDFLLNLNSPTRPN